MQSSSVVHGSAAAAAAAAATTAPSPPVPLPTVAVQDRNQRIFNAVSYIFKVNLDALRGNYNWHFLELFEGKPISDGFYKSLKVSLKGMQYCLYHFSQGKPIVEADFTRCEVDREALEFLVKAQNHPLKRIYVSRQYQPSYMAAIFYRSNDALQIAQQSVGSTLQVIYRQNPLYPTEAFCSLVEQHFSGRAILPSTLLDFRYEAGEWYSSEVSHAEPLPCLDRQSRPSASLSLLRSEPVLATKPLVESPLSLDSGPNAAERHFTDLVGTKTVRGEYWCKRALQSPFLKMLHCYWQGHQLGHEPATAALKGMLEQALRERKAQDMCVVGHLFDLGFGQDEIKQAITGLSDDRHVFFLHATLIDQTCADAWYGLGLICRREKDMREAVRCFQKAANLNHGGAYWELAEMCRLKQTTSFGTSQNAIQFYLQSLSFRYDLAYTSLGSIYYLGLLDQKEDKSGAIQLFEESAKLHEPIAMEQLAYLSLIERDQLEPAALTQALAWLQESLFQERAGAWGLCAKLYTSGKWGFPVDVKMAQICSEHAYDLTFRLK